MLKQITIGFTTEGSTDARFLESIIQRSFEEVALECEGQIEILPVQQLEKQSGEFVETMMVYAEQAYERSLMVFCVHTDADDETDTNAFNRKINPTFAAIFDAGEQYLCKNLVAIVPVQMIEAWMLSDVALLKEEIGTNKSNEDLGIHKWPESYADPKRVIEEAIRLARQDVTKRRRRELKIAELYLPIGQKITLNRLAELPSYRKFKEAIRDAFRKLNYLH